MGEAAILELVLPLLLKHLPGWFKSIDDLFSGKPKSGADKMATLQDMVRALIQKLLATGAVVVPAGTPAGSITDESLQAALEALFQQWKASGGELAPVPPIAPTGNLFLVRGQIIPIPAA